MLLLLSDKLLQLGLCLLLEQHGILKDVDRELHDEDPDWKLDDGELEDSLLHWILKEVLGLLQLFDMLLKLELCSLLEQHGI